MKPPGQPGPEFIPPGIAEGSVGLADRGQNRSFFTTPGLGQGGFFEGENQQGLPIPTGPGVPLVSGLFGGSGAAGGPVGSGVFGVPGNPTIFGVPTGTGEPPTADGGVLGVNSGGSSNSVFDEGDDADLAQRLLRRALSLDPERQRDVFSSLARIGRGLASQYGAGDLNPAGDLQAATRSTALQDFVTGDYPDEPFPG